MIVFKEKKYKNLLDNSIIITGEELNINEFSLIEDVYYLCADEGKYLTKNDGNKYYSLFISEEEYWNDDW